MQLKRATESQREVVMEGDNEEDEVHEVAMVASVVYDEDDSEEIQPVKEKLNMELYNTTQKETYKEVHVSDELTEEQRNRVRNLVEEFQDIFSDVPKITSMTEHRKQ